MQVQLGRPTPSQRLSVRQLLVGGTTVLVLLALVQVFTGREGVGPPPPSFTAATHATKPLIDVVAIGKSSIAVTNLRGWTPEQVRTYLSVLQKARASGALASVGIPTPSISGGYDEGVVYLIDGHPTPDLLNQFVRKEPPGYAQIASAVRGIYRWPPDRLTVGDLDQAFHD